MSEAPGVPADVAADGMIDAPIHLSGLLLKDERQLLLDAQRDLGHSLSLIGGGGEVVLGPDPPEEVLNAAAEAEAAPEGVMVPAGGVSYLCSVLFHDCDRLALIAAAPLPGTPHSPAVQRYLCRMAEVLLLSALRRTLAARVHVATVEDAYIELQAKNQRLEQAIQRMQEVDRIKANFLATVSHELRTPLTSVIGYSEMLMEGLAGPLNDEQREYLRTVMDKGEQLLQLITGILDISRMESSGIQLHRGPVDIVDLVRNVVATVTPQARRRQLDLEVRVQGGLPSADGDRDKLRQVLLNLVGNAIKFTPERGQVTISALVSAAPGVMGAPDQQEVLFSVADTGIGIPAHLYEKVFEPFFQVDSSSTREYEGTGLGLSIVRKFVEAHGGRVWISANAPQGTIFHLSVPIGGAHVPADQDLTRT